MGHGEKPIVIFGATGRQGGATARALLKSGWRVRAFVRDAATPAARALDAAGAELAQGALDETSSIATALEGAYGAFSMLPGGLAVEDEVRFGAAIADLAVDSGLAHLVYSSGASVGERPTGVARFDAKARIEAHVRRLPIAWTILRPAIFMEALTRPGFGLDRGCFTSLVRPDQTMRLIAVDDIGAFAAAVFADRSRYASATLRLAGDSLTGQDLARAFTEAAGRSIGYARLSDERLAASPDLAHMAASLEDGPLAHPVDLDAMRTIHPALVSLRAWLAGSGRAAFEQALGSLASVYSATRG